MMDVPEIESYSSLSHGKVGADVTVRCAAARTPRGSKQTGRRKIRVTIKPRLLFSGTALSTLCSCSVPA